MLADKGINLSISFRNIIDGNLFYSRQTALVGYGIRNTIISNNRFHGTVDNYNNIHLTSGTDNIINSNEILTISGAHTEIAIYLAGESNRNIINDNYTDGNHSTSGITIDGGIDNIVSCNKIQETTDIVDNGSNNTIIKTNNKKLETNTELKIKVYIQNTEPALSADQFMAIWHDTSVSGDPDVYLLYRRSSGDQVKVQFN